MFFGGSPRSNSATSSRRIRSLRRVSTGMVQQLEAQAWHMVFSYLIQVSVRSRSAPTIIMVFMVGEQARAMGAGIIAMLVKK
ncbi:hypothetical protein D3C76_1092340 [compost metagenome]